jgi:hypothetical protein
MKKFDDIFLFMADIMCHSFDKGFVEFNTNYKRDPLLVIF